jgi:hypothetical protein
MSAKEMMLCVQESLSVKNKTPSQISILIKLGGLLIKQYTNQKARVHTLVFFLEHFKKILDPEIDELKTNHYEEVDNHNEEIHICDNSDDECNHQMDLEGKKVIKVGDEGDDGGEEEENEVIDKRFGDISVSSTNTEMSKIISTEYSIQKKRDKLLQLYLPSILSFFECLKDINDDEDLSNRVFVSIVNILPILLPNLELFHTSALRLMQLIRIIGKKYKIILYCN